MKQICPYCRSGLDEMPEIRCDNCASPHHEACWELNGHCAVYGCSGKGIQSRLRWNVLPPVILIFGLFPAAQKLFLFLLLPLLLYTIAAIVSYCTRTHRV